MSDETTVAHAVEPEATHEETGERKHASFRLLPNSETGHLVRSGDRHDDTDDVNADVDAAEGHEGEHHRASFHKLPNSDTFHLVRGKDDAK